MSSASSWGCELKFASAHVLSDFLLRQPLREAVSWNVLIVFAIFYALRQPLREAVSWNTEIVKELLNG